MKKQKGFNFIELIIAMALATAMTSGVMSLFFGQSNLQQQSNQRDRLTIETHALYEQISSTLRQASAEHISIEQQEQVENQLIQSNDKISIRFQLPEGYPVWPNDRNQSNFTDKLVEITWSLNGDDNLLPYQTGIRNANSEQLLNSLPFQAISATQNERSPVLINLDFWAVDSVGNALTTSQGHDGSYYLGLTTRAQTPDRNFINPKDKNGPLKHYRTYTVSGFVTPRN